MDAVTFSPYNNYHISFRLKNGLQLSGIVTNKNEFMKDSLYTFIPTKSMFAWLKADKENDEITKKNLEMEVDIEDIASVEKL